MYVYVQSEKNLWTVGFYSPDGKWLAESDHETSDKAASRVAYLNGGRDFEEFEKRLVHLENDLDAREAREELAESVALWKIESAA